jgi:MoaE-MoaD fusion protein
VTPETVVSAGDEVGIFPPVSGGAPGSAGPFTRITAQPLDAGPLVALVRSPGHGAVIVFEGSVRSGPHDPVVAITYEAYEEMAAGTLAEIKAEVEARHPGALLAMAHRVGRLEAGETSVIVACGAPHRREAFAACRRAMDRIKEALPAWKREEAADGTTRWS